MTTTKRHRIVLVTAPDLKVARTIVRAALEARAAACANLVRAVESHYWWQGRLERGREVLLVFKTTTRQLRPLWNVVKARHPYDTPEFVVLPIQSGSRRYLAWVDGSMSVGGGRVRKA